MSSAPYILVRFFMLYPCLLINYKPLITGSDNFMNTVLQCRLRYAYLDKGSFDVVPDVSVTFHGLNCNCYLKSPCIHTWVPILPGQSLLFFISDGSRPGFRTECVFEQYGWMVFVWLRKRDPVGAALGTTELESLLRWLKQLRNKKVCCWMVPVQPGRLVAKAGWTCCFVPWHLPWDISKPRSSGPCLQKRVRQQLGGRVFPDMLTCILRVTLRDT